MFHHSDRNQRFRKCRFDISEIPDFYRNRVEASSSINGIFNILRELIDKREAECKADFRKSKMPWLPWFDKRSEKLKELQEKFLL